MSQVEERLMALGRFDIHLDPARTPASITDALDYFEHVLITKTRVDVDLLGVETLLYPSGSLFPSSTIYPGGRRPLLDEAAVYGGVIRKLPVGERFSIEGVSTLLWLGDENDRGPVIEDPIEFNSVTFETAVTTLLPDSVTPGLIFDQSTLYTGRHVYTTSRKALEYVCEYFGCEYRVRPNCSVDAGRAQDLYGGGDLVFPSTSTFPSSTTFPATIVPTAVAVRHGVGVDPELTGLHVASLDVERDVEEHVTRVLLLGEDMGGSVATGAAELTGTPFRDLHGNPLQFTEMVFEAETTDTNATRRATIELQKRNRARRQISISLDDFDVSGDHSVGHWIYVYDPDAGLVNPAIQRDYRGKVIFPVTLRVYGATWPVTEGMGVYWRDKAGTYRDLTDYVQFGSGATQLDVGDQRRPLIDRTDQREALRARVV